MSTPTTPLCDRIRDARIARNWSRDEFAAKVGRSKSTVCEWEAGNHYPRVGELRRIAKLLRADFAELLMSLATSKRAA